MPKSLHDKISVVPDHLMLKVMDMMKVRMRYLQDIKNHTYLFDAPDYETELGRNFISKLKNQGPLVNKKILADLHSKMQLIPDENFNADALNKACSIYLYEQNQKPDYNYKNEDVFFLFRYAMTGNPVGAPIGDISEVIGKKSVLERLVAAQEVFKN